MMNKLFAFFFCVPFLMALNAKSQINESEPNNENAIANNLPISTSVAGQVCVYTDPDFFRIVLPEDGTLHINTTVLGLAENPPQSLKVLLTSKNSNPWNFFNPAMGIGGNTASDEFEWCCLKADTFYLQVYSDYVFESCYNYTLEWDVIPGTFGNDIEPNDFYTNALDLSYNTNIEGHLNFINDPQGAGSESMDSYRIVPPMDGTMRLFVESDAQSTGSSNIHMMLVNANGSDVYNQFTPVGGFFAPNADTLFWPCTSMDTIYIRMYITNYFDRGYTYRIRYDMQLPAYGNDIEPNNVQANAQLVNPALPIEGHQFFSGDPSEDVFKFFKPDTGFFKIKCLSETYQTDNNGGHRVQLLDHNFSYIGELNATLGINSEPHLDSITFNNLSADTFYIKTYCPYAYAACRSYRLDFEFNPGVGVKEETTKGGFSLYPNPTNGLFYLENSSLAGNARIDIYNGMGQKVNTEKMVLPCRKELNLEGYTSGIYLVNITIGTKQYQNLIVLK
jgi:Secretion system C-terminal sorting domain